MEHRVLSIEELRRWVRSKVREPGGHRDPAGKRGTEFAPKAFARAIGLHFTDLYSFARGKKGISPERQRLMSRFVTDWENGLIEFGTAANAHGGKTKRVLVHRSTPKPRPVRMVLDLPHMKLRLIARPPASPILPSFKDVLGKVARK